LGRFKKKKKEVAGGSCKFTIIRRNILLWYEEIFLWTMKIDSHGKKKDLKEENFISSNERIEKSVGVCTSVRRSAPELW
jgi:hypothetical protein